MNKTMHAPYDKLKGKLKEKHLTYRDIAHLLDISEVAVANKINGVSDFYVGEAIKILRYLNLNANIFFTR